ncbi:efflux RND transporter periplasmic adaptor subunit [Sphingobacterium cellulitidis]|mgnify:CR=1 FL=1|uniref:RND transporter n=1 Tax=Sphingobacterium cellulitidis TaxID=1768011 RepID=A0A8H9KW50_9SPHI|nr:efflux RND transporter periplasmic adaptor subunit [Sphingobacterium soli]MBA8987837.1 membrane fusion protein (multidrug efflux system) [Sphingobacterium soli]OYD40270.1 efflux transporter periplasmic adaptor subunit [Sphingobacterium cellulitidis]GGE23389.1 RND transporter [Sphingobacterium soli]
MNTTRLFSTILLGSGLFFTACGNKEGAKQQGGPGQMQAQAMPVTMAVVQHEIVSGQHSYPANVVPLQETEIRAEVSGYITSINVADGAFVSKGQKLYEIDRVRYAAAVDQAKANLEIAKANLARVEKDLQRYQTLAEKDAIAKQTLDYAFTDVNNQKAQVQAAEAALTTARVNLQRSSIVAPFSGNIGISQVRTGALVSAGTTLLNTISSTNPIAVEFQINEKEIMEFSNLQSGKASTEINLTLPDASTYGSQGRISTIDRAVDPQTGTLKVRATFDNPNNTLRAGMNLNLNVVSTSKEEAVVIPYRAIFEQLGSFSVYTVTDSNTVDLKQVSLGQKLGDRVVISKGVNPGEKIVVDGVSSLKPGAKVVDKATMTPQQPQAQPKK